MIGVGSGTIGFVFLLVAEDLPFLLLLSLLALLLIVVVVVVV